MGRRVEGNGSPLPCLDVFKISKGENSNNRIFRYAFVRINCTSC